MWSSGGGQPGYYVCSHSGCQKKARNVDNWGRSSELLSGDHLCCNHPKHSTAHAYRARDREETKAAAARSDAPEGPLFLLIRSLVRRFLDVRR
jgi:hypothetical protein